MTDLSSVDLVALIERESLTRFGEERGHEEKRTTKGPCPFCKKGTDRFAIFVNDVPQHYFCGIHGNGCGAWGDAITFVREYLGIDDYFEACEYLKVDPDSKYEGAPRRKTEKDDQPPCDKWQVEARDFCIACHKNLESDKWGKSLLWYTKKRGLTVETVNRYALGYNPETRWIEPSEWGIELRDNKKIWLPRGWVIPYQVGGHLWKVSIRRPDVDITADRQRYQELGLKGEPPKYVSVSGGSEGLYGVNEIREGEPLVVVEGPLDKLIFTQVIGHRVPCVATGSTGQSRGERWLSEIRKASLVLIAFDCDEKSKAGDKAAQFWHDNLPDAARLTPWCKDVNEMHLAGMDLNEWLAIGLDMASHEPRTIDTCSICNMSVIADEGRGGYDSQGQYYCSEHCLEQQVEEQVDMSYSHSPERRTLLEQYVEKMRRQQQENYRQAWQRSGKVQKG